MATGHSKWFSLIYMLCCADSLSYVWLFATPWTLPGSSVYGDSPGQNTGVGCHALLQGLFPTQGSNPGLPHCRWWVLYRLSHQRNPRILEWVTYPFSRKWNSLTPVQLCNPVDCSLSGSSVHGILQARILKWVAISFSRASSQIRNQTRVSCTADGFFTRKAQPNIYVCMKFYIVKKISFRFW